jgi:hypothetical protein
VIRSRELRLASQPSRACEWGASANHAQAKVVLRSAQREGGLQLGQEATRDRIPSADHPVLIGAVAKW